MKLKELIENPIKLQRPEGVSNSQWVRALQLHEAAKNVGDKFPELTVAQAALETGWFKKESGKNNFFGQKASKNQEGSNVTTHEFIDGQRVVLQDKFRDYDSIENALLDRKNKWMSKYANAATPQEAISKIWRYDNKKKQGVGYATDPEYGKKINTILSRMGVNSTKKEIELEDTLNRKPKTPPLATSPISPDYATLPETEKQEVKKEQAINEEQLRKMFASEKKNTESVFLNAFQKNSQTQQKQYQPQYEPEDLSHLYNYIDIENYANGGEKDPPTEEEKAKMWLQNWYSNRKISDEHIDKAVQMDKPYWKQRLNQDIIFKETEDLPENVLGRYIPEENTIFRKKGDKDLDTVLHEYNHFANDIKEGLYSRTTDIDVIKNEIKPKKDMEGVYKEKYDYFSNPEEVKSRLMILRRDAGFKPDEFITEDKLDEFFTIKQDRDSSNIFDLINITKGKEGLLNLLNFTADISKPKQKNKFYAKLGGKLNKN